MSGKWYIEGRNPGGDEPHAREPSPAPPEVTEPAVTGEQRAPASDDGERPPWRVPAIALATIVFLGLAVVLFVVLIGGPSEASVCSGVENQCEADEVMELEEGLALDGFFLGQPDDFFDDATGDALYAFAACGGYDLDKTVEVGGDEWDEITDGVPPETMRVIPCAPPNLIESAQRRLADAGYGDLAVDGLFGTHSQAALRLFLADSGESDFAARIDVDSEDWFDLRDAAAEGDVATLSATLGARCRVLGGMVVITYGCSDPAVETLEAHLSQIGLSEGGANETFGRIGHQALVNAQNCLELVPDGAIEVDGKDWAAVFEMTSEFVDDEC
jgi:peptidoglycan hydrolase-like protein with peptidoglycan-binding domain